MPVAIVGDDELDSVVQEEDIEEANLIGPNSSSHPSTSSSNNIAVGVLIGVVDDDGGGNDDVIITPLQQHQTANVDSMYYDWTRDHGEVVYPPCCFDAIVLFDETGNGTGFGVCLMIAIMVIVRIYIWMLIDH